MQGGHADLTVNGGWGGPPPENFETFDGKLCILDPRVMVIFKWP